MFRQTINKLEKELKTLEKELRHELPQEIKKALAMGDLRENAEYHAALERQSFVKAKLGQLKKRLADISMLKLDTLPHDKVALGSTVVLNDLDNETEIRYDIVFSEDSDVAEGRISATSPIGKALLGAKEGDAVTVKVPNGVRHFEISSLRTAHQKEKEVSRPKNLKED